MNDLNSIIIEGKISLIPKCTETNKSKVCNLAIANNRYYKEKGADDWQKECSFIPVEVWNPKEYILKLKVGDTIRVEGRLKQFSWKDENDNQRHRLKVVADSIEVKPKRDTVSKTDEIGNSE